MTFPKEHKLLATGFKESLIDERFTYMQFIIEQNVFISCNTSVYVSE